MIEGTKVPTPLDRLSNAAHKRADKEWEESSVGFAKELSSAAIGEFATRLAEKALARSPGSQVGYTVRQMLEIVKSLPDKQRVRFVLDDDRSSIFVVDTDTGSKIFAESGKYPIGVSEMEVDMELGNGAWERILRGKE